MKRVFDDIVGVVAVAAANVAVIDVFPLGNVKFDAIVGVVAVIVCVESWLTSLGDEIEDKDEIGNGCSDVSCCDPTWLVAVWLFAIVATAADDEFVGDEFDEEFVDWMSSISFFLNARELSFSWS